MNNLILSLSILALMTLHACNLPAPRADDDTGMQTAKTACDFTDKSNTENRFALRDLNKVVILNNRKGNSPANLEIYKTTTCDLTKTIGLPIPKDSISNYSLAQIMYNNKSKVIGIRDYDKVYLYDAVADSLSQALVPKWLNPRTEDSKPGQILRLEVWENYLLGYVAEQGAFIFDLTDISAPRAVLPVAEYQRSDKSYSSLFLLPSENNKSTYQPIFPRYDYQSGTFEIISLFDRPQSLEEKLDWVSANKKIVVLKENSEANIKYAIDMPAQKLTELPPN